MSEEEKILNAKANGDSAEQDGEYFDACIECGNFATAAMMLDLEMLEATEGSEESEVIVDHE